MFSSDRYDDSTEPRDDPDSMPRYGAFEVRDGTTVVYDRENATAWIRSERAVEIDAIR